MVSPPPLALKMNGLGNAIVVLDLREQPHDVVAAEARAIAAMPGLAFDQMMVLEPPTTPGTAAFVRIFNTDGSEAGACGNGTRCVGWHLMGQSGASAATIETRAGLLEIVRQTGPDDSPQFSSPQFSVDMGRPGLGWRDVPLAGPVADTVQVPIDTGAIDPDLPDNFTAVSMGNPHAVFFVTDPAGFDLARIGPLLERHALFPERANISLVQVQGPARLIQRVWERGAGATLACGSGACAALVAAHRRGLTGRHAIVTLPGGDLVIDWRDDDHVIMTGPVAFEHAIPIDWAKLGPAA